MNLQNYIQKIPKVELHIHIEGSLEPDLMFKLAKRNNISLPFTSVEQVKAAYQFTNLQSFLDIYYQSKHNSTILLSLKILVELISYLTNDLPNNLIKKSLIHSFFF